MSFRSRADPVALNLCGCGVGYWFNPPLRLSSHWEEPSTIQSFALYGAGNHFQKMTFIPNGTQLLCDGDRKHSCVKQHPEGKKCYHRGTPTQLIGPTLPTNATDVRGGIKRESWKLGNILPGLKTYEKMIPL